MFWLLFTIFLLACISAGMTGGLFPPGPWYRALKKPSWTPPDWVFPVTWFVLYVCMSVAGARVALLPANGIALALWALQIALNGLWTPVFFGLQKIRMALGFVLALWVAVFACMLAMWQIDWVSGALFLPYLLWVTIASALNASVWRLNPEEARSAT
ncbi:MAG: TspO/MBR family protein [Paracoccaceae bacterium]